MRQEDAARRDRRHVAALALGRRRRPRAVERQQPLRGRGPAAGRVRRGVHPDPHVQRAVAGRNDRGRVRPPCVPTRRATRRAVRSSLEREVAGVDGPARILARPARSQGRTLVVVTGASLGDRDDTLATLARSFLIGGPIAVLLASGIGYLLATIGFRPVEAMRRRAERISLTQARRAAAAAGRPRRDPPARRDAQRDARAARGVVRARAAVRRRREPRAAHAARRREGRARGRDARARATARSVRESLVAALEETDHLAQLAEDLLLIARSADGRAARAPRGRRATRPARAHAASASPTGRGSRAAGSVSTRREDLRVVDRPAAQPPGAREPGRQRPALRGRRHQPCGARRRRRRSRSTSATRAPASRADLRAACIRAILARRRRSHPRRNRDRAGDRPRDRRGARRHGRNRRQRRQTAPQCGCGCPSSYTRTTNLVRSHVHLSVAGTLSNMTRSTKILDWRNGRPCARARAAVGYRAGHGRRIATPTSRCPERTVQRAAALAVVKRGGVVSIAHDDAGVAAWEVRVFKRDGSARVSSNEWRVRHASPCDLDRDFDWLQAESGEGYGPKSTRRAASCIGVMLVAMLGSARAGCGSATATRARRRPRRHGSGRRPRSPRPRLCRGATSRSSSTPPTSRRRSTTRTGRCRGARGGSTRPTQERIVVEVTNHRKKRIEGRRGARPA